MKSELIIILAIVVMALTALCIHSKELINNTSKENNYVVYKDEYFNISVEYPKNWNLYHKSKSNILFISPKKYDERYTTMNIQIMSSIDSGGKYGSIDDIISDLTQQFQERTNNSQVNFKREDMLGGSNAKEITFLYNYNGINYTQTQTITKIGTHFYALTYLSASKYYKEYIDVYKHAKSTFKHTYHEKE